MPGNRSSRIDRRSVLRLLSAGGVALGLAACGDGGDDEAAQSGGTTETTDANGTTTTPTTPDGVTFSPLTSVPDWTAETHGKLKATAIAANLPRVFRTDTVQRLDIVIENANWQLMKTDLENLLAGSGGGDRPDGSTPPDGGVPPDGVTFPDGGAPPDGSVPPDGVTFPGGGGGIGGGGGLDFFNGVDPVTVPCEIFYNGIEWYKVGIRFKGNSSLAGANGKAPMKLKFNEFEDQYPLISGQRFHGFKTLHLKSNYNDETAMHEALAADVFRKFGVPCSHVGFYQIYVDVGDGTGPQYFGLYSIVEDVEDTLIKTQFGDADGNLYKPEGDAASFAAGTYDVDEFDLKTNDDDPSYADVKALYDALNATGTYANDPAAWRAALEAVFDMPAFINWLAANTVLVNWDTYGVMSHNYYLYADATDGGRLTWIPWDNNEALVSNTRAIQLSLSGVGASWPLIQYVAETPEYFAEYRSRVLAFAGDVFNSGTSGTIDAYQALLAESIASERAGYTYSSASRFASAVSTLKSHVDARYDAALSFAAS